MRVRVHYFAQAREGAGREEEELELAAGASVGVLWGELVRRYPALSPLVGAVSFVVGEQRAEGETPLAEGDAVYVLPPVSGG